MKMRMAGILNRDQWKNEWNKQLTSSFSLNTESSPMLC